MFKKIKISVIFLALTGSTILVQTSYAFDDHGHDRDHHRHDWHAHANPDLTLVTGMDTIDTRVLIAADPDQTPDVIDQPEQVVETSMPNPAPTAADADESVTVNVPKSSGGYVPIRIEKWGSGYVGPHGEFYYPFPQVSELKAMYGI